MCQGQMSDFEHLWMETLGRFSCRKWPWKRKTWRTHVVMFDFNYLLISAIIVFQLISPAILHPLISSQSDCDWNGRGSIVSSAFRSIQTLTVRCTRGRIHWDDPIGGLRVELRPTMDPPYQLCLEDTRLKEKAKVHHRLFLEEGSSGRLLQVLSTSRKNSDCYVISKPQAILYVESSVGVSGNEVIPSVIDLAYEVEPLRGDGDPCRPCTDAEVLKTYCSADVVARGSIVQIVPGSEYDWIYIKSDLVLHQNQPVFTPFQLPMIKFLTTQPRRFDMDRPQRVTRSEGRGHQDFYQGIISHPTKCSAAVGDGDFLWLIKFRFGMPILECGLYWDKWVELSKSEGECPLSTN